MHATHDSTPASDAGNATAAYRARLERARTMLATLGVLLAHHEAAQREQPDAPQPLADLAALNEKLGQAAVCVTRGG